MRRETDGGGRFALELVVVADVATLVRNRPAFAAEDRSAAKDSRCQGPGVVLLLLSSFLLSIGGAVAVAGLAR